MIIRSYRVCRIVSEGYANQHITGANQRNQFRTWLVCVLAFFEVKVPEAMATFFLT